MEFRRWFGDPTDHLAIAAIARRVQRREATLEIHVQSFIA